jgi:hypothetical protein
LSDWEPATEAEAAMREALAASDQEHYFRLLSRMDLLLPVSADALAGRAPMGWGTWTTGNRTHVLAFTSPLALRTCFQDVSGSYRTLSFHALAAEWPNYEWWLAVNPGLPIEAYLPSWFVSQLTRGDVRLPGRTVGGSRARAVQSDLAAALGGRVRAAGPIRPAPTATASAPIPNGPDGFVPPQDPFIETVDAELIDYPPAAPETPVVPDPEPTIRIATPPVVPGYVEAVRPTMPGGGSVFDHGPTPPQPKVSQGPNEPAAAWTPPPARAREAEEAEIVSTAGPSAGPSRPSPPPPASFAPANETEANLLAAAESGNSDSFLSTLLLARIIVPVPPGTPPGSRPRDRGFPWRIEGSDPGKLIAVFTSPERMAEHPISRYGREMSSVSLRFVQLIGAWPDESIGFAVNLGSPVGATLPGSQIMALASWAAEVGLRDDPSAEIVAAPKRSESAPSSVAGAPAAGADRATVMQRTIPPAQLPFYLDRGYDRVSGFVNRASEVAHLTSPKSLYRALGLVYPGSPFADDDIEVHVLRWIAPRADLYRLPYGGQHEAAMRAMQGWVVERAPFRGNGFAPGDTEVIAEFKVDSIRLPHGAQLWRLQRDGEQKMIATFDADATRWAPAPPGFTGGLYA